MSELLANIEKESAAAAEIEDRFRRAAMKLQVLSPDDVQTQPTSDIGVFRVMLFRAGVLRLDRSQLRLINATIDRLERNRMGDPFHSTPRAPIRQRLDELRDLMGKLHPIGRVAAVRPRPARIE